MAYVKKVKKGRIIKDIHDARSPELVAADEGKTLVVNSSGNFDVTEASGGSGVGPLPSYGEISHGVLVTDFLTSNDLNNKPFIFNYLGSSYLAKFASHGQTLYGFEIEEIGGARRYVSTNADLSGLTFSSLVGSDSIYKQDYEITNNKVTSLSSSSTDTEYPSAKVVYDNLALKEDKANKVTSLSASSTDTQYPSAKTVYDECVNIREVAEGKCKTYVLSNAQGQPSSYLWEVYHYYDFTDNTVKSFESQQHLIDWLNNLTYNQCLNSTFNSNVDSLQVSFRGYLVFESLNDVNMVIVYLPDSLHGSIQKLFNLGDIFLVKEIDVPDRWYSGLNYYQGYLAFNKLETSKIDLASYPTFSNLNDILGGIIRGVYDSTSTYALGDLVIHDNKLYRCTTAISVAESWDSTHWTLTTVDSEFAKESQGFNVINASDIVSNTLTQAQYDLITNGKPTIILGTFRNLINPLIFSPRTNIAGVITRGLYIGHAPSGNQQFGTYQINQGTLLFELSGQTQENIDLNCIGAVNGKIIPSYPSSPTTSQFLGYKPNNTLAYLSKLFENASGYGLVPPDTSSFTADKEIATTDYFGFKVIPAPSSANLSDDEIAVISGGCIINGTFLNEPNPVFMPTSTPQFNEIAGIMFSGEGLSCNIYVYSINTSSKVITKYSGQSAKRLSLSGILRINGKNIPDYPSLSSGDIQKQLIYKDNNTLAWDNVGGFAIFDSITNNTLTEEMVSALKKGGIIINGQVSSSGVTYNNPILFKAQYSGTGDMWGICLVYSNSVEHTILAQYRISQSNKTFGISSYNWLNLKNIQDINGKDVNGSVFYKELASSNIGTLTSTPITTGWCKNVIAVSNLSNAIDVRVEMSDGSVHPAVYNGNQVIVYSDSHFVDDHLSVDAIYYKDN